MPGRVSRGDAPGHSEWIPALWSELTPSATSAGMTMVGSGGWGWGSFSNGVVRARMRDALGPGEWIPALWSECPPNATSAGMTMVGLARGSVRFMQNPNGIRATVLRKAEPAGLERLSHIKLPYPECNRDRGLECFRWKRG